MCLSRDECMVHPQLPPNVSWTSKHAPARTTERPHRVALCLFGIPASVGRKAGLMHQNASLVKRAAISQLAALPPNVDVYSHAWLAAGLNAKKMCARVVHSYRPRAHKCEPLVFDTRRSPYSREHVWSMVLSIVRVLALATKRRYAQLVLARHDVLFCDRVPFVQTDQFVVVGSWADKTMDGVPDYAFTGDPIMLAHVFETLNTRFERHEARQTAPNLHDRGWRAHFVVQAHLDDLGLTRRRYVTHVDVRQRLLREVTSSALSTTCCILPCGATAGAVTP